MSGSSPYVPDRGDIVWLDFDPQAGREQYGHRPALVMTKRSFNVQTGFAIVIPITSRAKGYPFELALPAGLPIQGVLLCDQIKSQDWQARGVRFAGVVPAPFMFTVASMILPLIA